jgi:flagellar basal body-associated protein FliL
MSWQEELRRLDTELAAGTISSSEHRRRREDILAEVSGAPLVSPAPAAASSTTPSSSSSASSSTSSTSTSSSSTPDKPESSASNDPSEPSAASKDSEKPQDTPGGTTSEPHGDDSGWRSTNPARTTSDPAGTTPPTPSDFFTPSGSRKPTNPLEDLDALRATAPNAAALLSGAKPTTAPSPADERPTELIRYPDLPPPSSEENRSDTGEEGPRRPALTWVAISGAVLVALGAVIGGAWWLGQDSSDPAPVSTTPSGEVTPTDSEVALADKLPTLPGEQSPNNSTMSVDRGAELGLYPEQTANFFTEHGVTEVIVRGSLDGSTGYLLLVLRTGEPAQAQHVAEHLYQVTLPEKSTESEGPPRIASGFFEQKWVHGAWYASNEYAVALVVTEPSNGEPGTLSEKLQRIVEPLQEVLPAH